MVRPVLKRWDGRVEPTESELADLFAGESLRPYSWSNGPGDVYGAHSHAYHKVLYCLRGSIVFRVHPGGEEYELEVGDRLDLPDGVSHSAVVGPQGVTCLEAAR
jgi:quercetin dioxygenase-like cupin family protein